MKEFQELYRLYSKQLFNYLFYLTNDRLLAEDLMQETFYQAFKSIHRFKGNSKVKTWLYQIAKHIYYKHAKKRMPSANGFDENDGESAIFQTPELILEKEEETLFLHQGIRQLKEPYKQVVILRSFNELSFREIGEIFLKSENWSRVMFHRGKQQLRAYLQRGD